jgi:hypothetical protein
MNPNQVTPLAGEIDLNTTRSVRVSMQVSTQSSSWTVDFPGYRRVHALPLLGLKPNSTYTIDLTLTDETGETTKLLPALQASTEPLPEDFPRLQVLISMPDRMEPGYTLMDRFVRGPGEPTGYTIIVNNKGEVVWYSPRGSLATRRLPDGNLQFVLAIGILEMDLLGNSIETIFAGESNLSHELFATEYGTYLSLTQERATVDNFPISDTDPDRKATAHIFDAPVVEYSSNGVLQNVWRLRDIIDPVRIGYNSLNYDETAGAYDWAHGNGVVHDPRDDSIIASVRHQDALVKFERTTGKLKWILGNHANWSQAFMPYLLEPTGAPFTWQYHQHAPTLTPSGTILLMDNGNWRASPFDGTRRQSPNESSSRAVEYSVDEEKMEVRELWEYGGNIDERIFSVAMGSATMLPSTGNVLITFGSVIYTDGVSSAASGRGASHARIVEVDKNHDSERVFDMVVFDPDPSSQTNIYRSQRISGLYSFPTQDMN